MTSGWLEACRGALDVERKHCQSFGRDMGRGLTNDMIMHLGLWYRRCVWMVETPEKRRREPGHSGVVVIPPSGAGQVIDFRTTCWLIILVVRRDMGRSGILGDRGPLV